MFLILTAPKKNRDGPLSKSLYVCPNTRPIEIKKKKKITITTQHSYKKKEMPPTIHQLTQAERMSFCASFRSDGLGPFLSSNFFPQIFLFFSPRKTRKAGQTGNVSKICKFNRGQNILEGFAFQHLEEKIGKYGNTKNARKKYLEISTKSPSIRTALTLCFINSTPVASTHLRLLEPNLASVSFRHSLQRDVPHAEGFHHPRAGVS